MPAFAWRADDRADDLGAVDHAAEIDRDRPVPAVELLARRGPAAVHPRVVAQHVDLAERIERLLRRVAQAVAVGDIGLHEVHRVVTGKLLARLGDVLVAPVGEADLHPLLEKRARHAETDAAGPAGDEGDLACQVFHSSSPTLSLTGSCSL